MANEVWVVTVANDPGTSSDGTTVVGTLSWAIAQVNATNSSSQTIQIQVAGTQAHPEGYLTLSGPLSPIFNSVTISGNGAFIDAQSMTRIFMVGVDLDTMNDPRWADSIIAERPQVTINDLTLANGLAHGGDSAAGGGGGLGAGGALFVNQSADVTLTNVTFSGDSAVGGSSSSGVGAGGGGGLGGDGGSSSPGGGGGIFGNGGGGFAGGAAGGGIFGNGGDGTGVFAGGGGYSGNGGSGGAPGQPGTLSIAGLNGTGGDGAFGGAGGADGGGGGSSLVGTAGGGGFDGGDGAAQGGLGGFGGGGGAGSGAGGFGGGGATGSGISGGNGGFGGGGGGATGNDGGEGGFGGGGGASVAANGGLGGFGGGGGGGSSGGGGGFGGGNGSSAGPGGGGAGMGGAVFVMDGGTLHISGAATDSGGSVAGGGGANPGSAFGSGFFLQGFNPTVVFDLGESAVYTVADVIADQFGSFPDINNAGFGNLTLNGIGTLVLTAVNQYTGETTINGGTLEVDGSIYPSQTTVNAGGILAGIGTTCNIVVNSGGYVAPGHSPNISALTVGILNTDNETFHGGSTYLVDIAGTTVGSDYDRLNALGGVTLENATLSLNLAFSPLAGDTFTIIDTTDGVTGTFNGLSEGATFVVGSTLFTITYAGGVDNNDVVLTTASGILLNGFGPSVTYLENAVNNAPQLLDSDVTFVATNPLTSGGLTVSGLLPEDRVSLENIGGGSGEIGFDSNTGTVSYESVVIGTATGGVGNDLTVTFNSSATGEAVDALIQALTFADISDTPTAARTLNINVTDGTSASTGDVPITVNVTSQNDQPSIDLLPTPANYTENNPPVALTPGPGATWLTTVLASDPDDANPPDNGPLLGATVTITNGQTGDRLLVDQTPLDSSDSPVTSGVMTGLNIAFAYDATTHTLTFTSADPNISGDTIIDYEVALSHIYFASTSDNPTNFGANPTRTLAWQVQDAGGTANGGNDLSSPVDTTINVVAINDRPVLSNVAPATFYVVGSSGTVLSPGLLVSDPDSTVKNATVQITDGYLLGDQLSVNLPNSGGFFVVDEGGGPVTTNIAVSYSALGRLVLTGTDTTQHYQDVLDAVSYASTAGDPTNAGHDAHRTISWQVNDGAPVVGPLLAIAAPTYSVGITPQHVITADLNGDGALDLVTPNSGSNTVSVLLGSTTTPGTFGLAGTVVVGVVPSDVAIADLNGDGKLDLAVSEFGGGVHVLFGTGTGSFGPGPAFAAGPVPIGVAVGDFNNDGKADLAVAHSTGVSVLLGIGGGAFALAMPFTTGTSPSAVLVADFNNDGKADIGVADAGSSDVAILLGNGVGGFAAATTFTTGAATNPQDIATADLNGDGVLDLVTANASGNVSVLLGNGSGGFGIPSTFATASNAFSISIGDMNADGVLDLAIGNRAAASVSILLGNGDGTFAPATNFSASAAVGTLGGITLGEFNRDGGLDVAASGIAFNNLALLFNNSTNASNVPLTTVTMNRAPVAQNGSVSGNEDNAITGNATATDPDNDPFTLALVGTNGGAAHGTVLFNPDGSFTYTAVGNFNGSDSFSFNAADNRSGTSNTASISITVNPVNDAPSGANNTVNTNEDTAYTFTVADFGFSDPLDGNALLAVKITTLPGAGTLTDNNVAVGAGTFIPVADITGGKLKFVPAADANGAGYASFTFQVQDNGGTANGGTDTDPSPNTITVNVAAINDAPVIISNGGGDTATISVVENTNAVTTVHATDVDSPTLTYSIVGGADQALFQINSGTGALSFIAAPNFEAPADSDHNNSYLVTVRASDGSLSDNQALTVNVTDVFENINAGFHGDFNGDHKADLLLRGPDGTLTLDQMNGAAITTSTNVGQVGSEWHIQSVADFDGNSLTDVLWRADNGTVVTWLMNGAHISANTILGGVGNEWHINGTADFGGDGKADILWRGDSGALAMWQMNGNQIAFNTGLGTVGNEWHVEALGDFGGDHKGDILWRADNGAVALWQMNGSQVLADTSIGSVGNEWHIVGSGDFNGDGKNDILWRADNGTVAIWQMDGANIQSNQALGVVGNEWRVDGTGDFNGDGKADIVWRGSDGSAALWTMDGTHIANQALLAPIAADITLAVHHYDLV